MSKHFLSAFIPVIKKLTAFSSLSASEKESYRAKEEEEAEKNTYRMSQQNVEWENAPISVEVHCMHISHFSLVEPNTFIL